MDEEWRRRFRDEVLPELSFRFDLDASTLEVVQDHRNLVYKGSSVLGKVVLKTIASAESHHNLLLGELDWMAHLHTNGVRVPRPLTSRDGHLVETVVAGGRSFSACCYQRIEGPLWQQVHNRSDLIGAVGQLAGKMHAVSAGYVPGWEGAIRPTWTDSPWFASPSDAIHPSMPAVIERCLELREALSNLPTSDYGIVHNDLHGGNIIISPDGPVAIDFECSEHSWLVSEIASKSRNVFMGRGVSGDSGTTGYEWASKSQTRFQARIAQIEKWSKSEQQGRDNAAREVCGVMGSIGGGSKSVRCRS